jgi:sugar phosphate isomerase/epimerase
VAPLGVRAELSDAAASVGLPAYPVGCYTRPWDTWPLETALDGIAEAGYRYAGIMTAKGKSWVVITPATKEDEAVAVGETAHQRGLRILSVYGDFSVAASMKEGVSELRRLVMNCAACGSPDLLLGGTGDARLYEAYFGAIAECCDYAEGMKVRLTVKPHGGLNATGPLCRQAIERVGHPNFRLWYDPGNILYYSDGTVDPVKDAASVDGVVVGMCVKDFQPPKEVLVTPGTGQVDFGAVLNELRRGGFRRGPLIVECTSRGDFKQVTRAAARARVFLQTLVEQMEASAQTEEG